MAEAARAIQASGIRCLVCGCDEVHTDEVVDREVVFLAECPRCDYRWTSRTPRPHVRSVAVRAPGRAAEEVATAA
jgi:uncharacterized Zn finger protein